MERYRKYSFKLTGIVCFSTLFLLVLLLSQAQAGAPVLDEVCRDWENRPVKNVYDSSLQVFAEVRPVPQREQSIAMERGLSPYVIHINPELYYLGRYTQQWLYLRQCAHIRERHAVIQEGIRGLRIEDEQQADCQAIRAMRTDQDTPVTSRQIYSIERDIERLLRENRWSQVLAGPQRRISLESCMREKSDR